MITGPQYQTPERPALTEDERRAADRPGGILALDVATTTGWAYVYPGNQPEFGAKRCGPIGAKDGEVLHLFENWLDAELIRLRPKYIVYEAVYVPQRRKSRKGPRWAGEAPEPSFDLDPTINVHVLARLFAMTRTVDKIAYQRSIECREIGGLDWCRWFTGTKGNFGGRANKKAQTLKAASTIWGFEGPGGRPLTEDEADALGIALYAETVYAPKTAHRRAIGPRRELDLAPHQDRIGRRIPS